MWFNSSAIPNGLDVWNGVQPAPRSSGIRVSIDHFPKSCEPPEYHLRSIKRLKKKKSNSKQLTRSLSRNSSWELGYWERRCGFNTMHQSTFNSKRSVTDNFQLSGWLWAGACTCRFFIGGLCLGPYGCPRELAFL